MHRLDEPRKRRATVNFHVIGDRSVLIAAADDALTLLGISPPADARAPMPTLPETEQKVWDALDGGFAEMDSLPSTTGLSMAECLAAVTSLEILALVECSLAGEIRRR